jgi:hypothetical protein
MQVSSGLIEASVSVGAQTSTVLSYYPADRNATSSSLRQLSPTAITHQYHRRGTLIPQTALPQASGALAVLSTFWAGWSTMPIERNVARASSDGRKISSTFSRDRDRARPAITQGHRNRPAAPALRWLASGAGLGSPDNWPRQLDIGRGLGRPHKLTKQKKTHILPLQPEALTIAQALLAIGLPNYTQCKLLWKQVRIAIGRPEVTIHDLRHSRASALARNGASLPMIGQVLGHASASTTARYAHLVDGDLRDLVERT